MVEILERIVSRGESHLYRLSGSHETTLCRYIATTPEGRQLCNRPELLGMDFSLSLTQAVTKTLSLLPERDALLASAEERVSVVHFLRGGLNFGLREALHGAYGMNRHGSSFMSSQRRRVDGRWQVEEDRYRKLRVPTDAILVMGDVVATGLTTSHGLEVLLEHTLAIGSSIKRLLFVTIGCHKVEKVLQHFDTQFRAAFPDYEGASLVYLEGKFRLVNSQTPLSIAIPGTDLVRREAVLAPEMALANVEELASALERCAIYDAGSRAFDVPTYVEDVRGYWQRVHAMAGQGLTLKMLLEERWPDLCFDEKEAFERFTAAHWLNVDGAFVQSVWERVDDRRRVLESVCGNATALRRLASRRLDEIPSGESLGLPREDEPVYGAVAS